MAATQKRAIVYIDGFNLYFGLIQRGWQKYLWLDLKKFAASLLVSDQVLTHTKYFTSRISKPVSKQRLQSIFIDALNTLAEFSIYYGRYQAEIRTCENCGFKAIISSEKKTDVNVATELLVDAFQDKFDTAVLVTADADLSWLFHRNATPMSYGTWLPVFITLAKKNSARIYCLKKSLRHLASFFSVRINGDSLF